jgi:hypothetical protein
MCTSKRKCEKPSNLKDKPENCSPAQIRKCHGDAKAHLCAKGKKTE